MIIDILVSQCARARYVTSSRLYSGKGFVGLLFIAVAPPPVYLRNQPLI